MKFRDPETGEFKELYTKAADTLPVGTEVDYDGDEVPAGWEEMYDEDEKSFAQMHTNQILSVASGDLQEVDIWGSFLDISEGQFYCDATNKRIVIPPNSAEYVEIGGAVSGSGKCDLSLEVWDNTKVMNNTKTLLQDEGYKAIDIPNLIVKLPDKTKIYYVKMFISGYSGVDFNINSGFSERGTYMTVRKIK